MVSLKSAQGSIRETLITGRVLRRKNLRGGGNLDKLNSVRGCIKYVRILGVEQRDANDIQLGHSQRPKDIILSIE